MVFKEENELYHIFLTKGSGMILGPIERLLGGILNYIYIFLMKFGIENVGIAIILFTFLVKTLMTPLTIKQQKSTKLTSAMNPEIMEIQKKYKGKSDNNSKMRMQAEVQAVYDKYGSSPTAGCMPMLITLPIMMGLYRVIYKLAAYIEPIKEQYTEIANKLDVENVKASAEILVGYGKEVGVKAAEFQEFKDSGILTTNHAIDILMKFKPDNWDKLAESFKNLGPFIEEHSAEILRVNSIPGGINLLESPGFTFPAILIPIVAVLIQVIQSKLTTAVSTPNSDNPSASSMNAMTKVMPLMQGVFCLMLPVGIGLYLISNSAFTVVQQFFINKSMDDIDVDELIEKNKKKKKPNRFTNLAEVAERQSIEDIAKKSTKTINPYSNNNRKSGNLDLDNDNSSINGPTKNKSKSSPSGTSISHYANVLNNRNHDKEDK